MDPTLQLSRNFWLKEFLFSETAARMGRSVVPTPDIIECLRWHAEFIMQPIRDDLQVFHNREISIRVLSGYRPLWLNTLVGGATNSDHMWGGAVDFVAVGIPVYDLGTFIAERIDRYPIAKLIYEFGDWIHISAPPIHDRLSPARKIMTATRVVNTTRYTDGIVKEI